MLGDSIASALPGMQAHAESLMDDACQVREIVGTTQNPDGTVSSDYVTVYEGKCRLQSRNPYPSNPDAGEHAWTLETVELHLPVAAGVNVGTDHVVTVTASVQPVNVGRIFRVRSRVRKTWQSAARFVLQEVTG